MRFYQSHKIIEAYKIVGLGNGEVIVLDAPISTDSTPQPALVASSTALRNIWVGDTFIERHSLLLRQAGSLLVIYPPTKSEPAGHMSVSPGDAFAEGYSYIGEGASRDEIAMALQPAIGPNYVDMARMTHQEREAFLRGDFDATGNLSTGGAHLQPVDAPAHSAPVPAVQTARGPDFAGGSDDPA